jgi:hypothetical protein
LVVAIVGMGWLSRVSVHTSYWPGIGGPLFLLGIGIGIGFITLTGRGIAGVSDQDAGVASGLVNVFHQVGGCLGVAVMTTVFVKASSSATTSVASHTQALSHGVSAVLTGSTISLILGLAVVLATTRRRPPATVVSTAPAELADAVAA